MTERTADIERFDPKDEPLPFLSNFQDIFLSIGVVILLVGIMIVSLMVGGNFQSMPLQPALLSAAGLTVSVLLLVWILSDVLVRKHRRILPGIILCMTFVGLSVLGFGFVYGAAANMDVLDAVDVESWDFTEGMSDNDQATDDTYRQIANSLRDAVPMVVKGFLVGAPLMGLFASFLFYRRFKLPFSSALVAVAACGLVIILIMLTSPYDAARFSPTIGLLAGLALLVAGVVYDMKDPARVSRFSGNGFWLHFFAAPVLLTNVLTITSVGFVYDFPALSSNIGGVFENQYSVGQSIVTLIVIAGFALISLLLNRRALIVSGLVSA
ncbi:MAG: hypothetical protein AAF986_06070, partial [Pseudomonadota bacterium]